MPMIRAVALFIAAGVADIGGGYLIWRWLRENGPVIVGILGAITPGCLRRHPDLAEEQRLRPDFQDSPRPAR